MSFPWKYSPIDLRDFHSKLNRNIFSIWEVLHIHTHFRDIVAQCFHCTPDDTLAITLRILLELVWVTL